MYKIKPLHSGETKERVFLILLICLLGLGKTLQAHPFYVSVTEIHYRPAKQELQISMKTFSDDLEHALDEQGLPGHRLGAENAPDSLQAGMVDYLKSCFRIVVNGQPMAWNYLGCEVRPDATWHYMVVRACPSLRAINICNRVFFQLYDRQRNLIRITVPEGHQSRLLERTEPCAKMVFSS